MANAVKWSALGTFTTVIAGASSSPTLKNLANNTGKLSNEIDNATSARDTLAEFDLYLRCASAPSGAPFISMYFIECVDGTNYEDGGDSTRPLKAAVATFPSRLVATQQRVAVSGIPIPPVKFKVLLWNDTGQGLTNTDNENILSIRTYNPEIQ